MCPLQHGDPMVVEVPTLWLTAPKEFQEIQEESAWSFLIQASKSYDITSTIFDWLKESQVYQMLGEWIKTPAQNRRNVIRFETT